MFLHPHILWLLVLPLLLLAWQLRGTVSNKWPHAALRMLALSFLILALARPFHGAPETARPLIAVVDVSAGMDDDAMEKAAAGLRGLAGRDGMRFVVFGATAREIPLKSGIPTANELIALRSENPGSDIAGALAFAASLCPDDGLGVIHLFSDGRETDGEMLAAAAALGRRGLGLAVHETGATHPAPALLLGLQAPPAAAIGEAVKLVATVEARETMEATLRIRDEKGADIAARTVTLSPGVQELSFPVRPDAGGLLRYGLTLDGGDQSANAAILIRRTVIGVIESAPDAPATQVLRALLGGHAEIKPLAAADLTEGGLAAIDVLAMADTPAAELPAAAHRALRGWVENGGGLLVTGGRNSFGPGGYGRSEIAALLPLRFPQKKEVRDPSSALAVIIDTSGSMGLEGVNLAKEVARLALKRLKPHDKAGIVEFHGAKRWAAPMQPAANSIAIQRALNRLSAGGGTVMLPALEEAYYGMLNLSARTKHVLVLTDGGVEQGAFENLLRRMADDGVQVSTVLVGPRSGSGFLSQLAGWGGGQFYTAPSRFQLPEIIVKQPSGSLLDPFVETETALMPVASSRLTRDLAMASAPPLRGYVKTQAKDSAELLLRSGLGDPVLARWHYGAGRVAVLTTSLGGDWAGDFLKWPSAAPLMANLTRQLAGVSPRETLALRIDPRGGGIDLGIRALAPDPALAAAPLRIVLRDGEGDPVAERTLPPTRAHTWSARFESAPPGACLVEVTDAAGEKVLASGGVFVPPPNEFTRAAPDRARLAAAAETARAFAAKASAAPAPRNARELWPPCAALGLVSFLLMILARRLPAIGQPRPVSH